MKVDPVKSNVVFKSGYPTFGSNGHLSYKPEVSDHIYLYNRVKLNPSTSGLTINYLA